MATLSKKLVTIQLDVPHDVKFDELRAKPYDKEKLQDLFMELEFDTLGKKLLWKDVFFSGKFAKVIREKRESEIQATLFDEPVDEKTIRDVQHEYHTVVTHEERAKLIKLLATQEKICFDTETTGLDPRTARPLGLAFSVVSAEAYYVVLPDDEKQTQEILEEFRAYLKIQGLQKLGIISSTT